MPWVSNVYQTPKGTDGVPGQTISSTAYNINVHDVETALNGPIPVLAGGTGASDKPTALKNLGAMPAGGAGQCYLSRSGSNLLLSPYLGNMIFINGNVELIPDAGVQLVPTGTLGNSLYYIYAYMVGTGASAVMTLEFSATAYATQAGTGVRVKSGDVTRTLVGMWLSGSAANNWGASTAGASWFNPKQKTITLPVGANSTTATPLVEVSGAGRLGFVSFSDREVRFGFRLDFQQSVNTASAQFDISFNAASFLWTNIAGAAIKSQPATAAGDWTFVADNLGSLFSEGVNYLSTYYGTSTGLLAIERHSIWAVTWG